MLYSKKNNYNVTTTIAYVSPPAHDVLARWCARACACAHQCVVVLMLMMLLTMIVFATDVGHREGCFRGRCQKGLSAVRSVSPTICVYQHRPPAIQSISVYKRRVYRRAADAQDEFTELAYGNSRGL
eukprot:2679825-Pyramimonas_sp.AAC.1